MSQRVVVRLMDAIEADDLVEFERLSNLPEARSQCDFNHCLCLESKNESRRCQFLLEKAVRLRRARMVDLMLSLGYPTSKTCLSLSDDVQSMRRLYEAGCRFTKWWISRVASRDLEYVKMAIEECGFDARGNFRTAWASRS